MVKYKATIKVWQDKIISRCTRYVLTRIIRRILSKQVCIVEYWSNLDTTENG